MVVRFSRTRRRYERQGVLVEEAALVSAEVACLADEEVRRRRRSWDEARRAAQDLGLQAAFADEISRILPGCPRERTEAIAHHACSRSSGRVGRSAAGRALRPEAVLAAVVASVRHVDTSYDTLLMTGIAREEARRRVQHELQAVLDAWQSPLLR